MTAMKQRWWIIKINLQHMCEFNMNSTVLLCFSLMSFLFFSRILYIEQMRGAGCFYTRSRILNSFRTVSVGNPRVLN